LLGPKPKDEDIRFVMEFGFTKEKATEALKQCNLNKTQAVEYCFAKFTDSPTIKAK